MHAAVMVTPVIHFRVCNQNNSRFLIWNTNQWQTTRCYTNIWTKVGIIYCQINMHFDNKHIFCNSSSGFYNGFVMEAIMLES